MSIPERADRSKPAESLPVDLADTIENELVPRMMLAHRVGAVPPSVGAAVGRKLSDADRAEFIRLIRGSSETAAGDLVNRLVENGTTVESVYLDLLAPAARFMGQEWDNDSCDFVEVTIALGRMQRVLRNHSRVEGAEKPLNTAVGSILLSAAPGEQHTLGLYIVAEFFVRAGWAVQVGSPVAELDLVRTVREDWFDVVGFSVYCDTKLPHLARDIAAVRKHSRNPKVRLLVGGQVFEGNSTLLESLGADGSAIDGIQAVQVATDLLGLSPA